MVSDGRAVVRGDVLLSIVEDRLGVALSADDVDTIGGWVWHRLGRLPEAGDVVAGGEDHPEIRVEAMDGRAVRSVSFALDGVDR